MALGRARDADTPTTPKLEKAFVAQVSECSKHCVLVDSGDCREIARWRKSLSRLCLTLGDRTPQIRGDPQVERNGLVCVGCHGQMILSLLVSFHEVGPAARYRHRSGYNDVLRATKRRGPHN